MISSLSLENPVFWTYALAASIMLLKLMLQPWMTVVRMRKVNGGFRNPEDAKKSLCAIHRIKQAQPASTE